MLIVERSSPLTPEADALLKAHHGLMTSLFPVGDCHFLGGAALAEDHVTFYTARIGTEVVGMGALAAMEGYGEVKSMFTTPEARGKGVADAILRAVEDTAKEAGLSMLKLETGTGLDAAHRLYQRHGFQECGPFGSYAPSPHSVYFEKEIA